MLKQVCFRPFPLLPVILSLACGRAAPGPTQASNGTSVGGSEADAPAPAGAPSVSSHDNLSFAPQDVDIGVADGTVTQEYRYTNVGERPLDIVGATPSCSCTVTRVDLKRLAAGDGGVLTVETDLARKPPGRHIFTVDVDFKVAGAETQRTRLTLRAQNRPDIWVEPNELVMHVRAGGRGTMILRIDDYRDTPLKILGTETVGVAGVTVITPKSPERANGVWSYLVEVVAAPNDASPDRAHGDLLFATDDPSRPELRVAINLVTTHRVVAIPATVWLRPDDEKNLLRGKVSLRDADGEPVEVEKVAFTCQSLACEKTAARFGPASITFDLTLPEESAAGVEFPLQVRLKVKSPCEQEVPITIMAPLGWRPSS